MNGTFFAPNMAAVQVNFFGRTNVFYLQIFCLQDGDLFILGQYVAMSIAQGAGGFPFLSESVFKYLTTGVALGVTIENTDINDGMLRFVVNKVILILQTPCTTIFYSSWPLCLSVCVSLSTVILVIYYTRQPFIQNTSMCRCYIIPS